MISFDWRRSLSELYRRFPTPYTQLAKARHEAGEAFLPRDGNGALIKSVGNAGLFQQGQRGLIIANELAVLEGMNDTASLQMPLMAPARAPASAPPWVAWAVCSPLGIMAIPGVGPVVAADWLARRPAHVYAEGVRRGGTLVTAKVEDSLYAEAQDILRQSNWVDPDQRREAYAKEAGLALMTRWILMNQLKSNRSDALQTPELTTKRGRHLPAIEQQRDKAANRCRRTDTYGRPMCFLKARRIFCRFEKKRLRERTDRLRCRTALCRRRSGRGTVGCHTLRLSGRRFASCILGGGQFCSREPSALAAVVLRPQVVRRVSG